MTAPTDLPCYRNEVVFQFNGVRRNSNYQAHVKAAKALCATCPVRQACLARWLRAGDPDGDPYEVIVGGTTKAERRAMSPDAYIGQNGKVYRRQPIEHATPNGYRQHRQRGEEACSACKRAHTDAVILRRKERAA